MTSRLADQQSSYLRSAKDQPVNWHPWGPEAFELARAERKPVLLDIGAVWCHWCHVMDHESYEDPAIAELLNDEWICIKVDRDERPDVDVRYQRAVQALSGQGGWPLTAFLTPDGEVFFGGTYFPPDNRHGRPGFRAVLTELARLFREDAQRVAQQAQQIKDHLSSVAEPTQPAQLSPDLLSRAADAMAGPFDFRHGGFGTQPKFPHPGALDFLLTRWFDSGEPWAAEIVHRTLSAMARGGIRDHVGGGFHRYSVDARWIVPHFEKMSYDNSELLGAYAHAATAPPMPLAGGMTTDTQGPELYREVVAGIVRWVQDVMSDPSGGYYASQDADVGPDDDGDYFTWTPDEARDATEPEEFEVLARRFDIEQSGEMHHNPRKNVLWLRQSPADIAVALGMERATVERLLVSGLDSLKRARDQRPRPFVDTTLYTGWNGLMASAMLSAAALLDRHDLEQHALLTLERLFEEAAAPDLAGGMRHAPKSPVSGILDDQLMVAQAALDALEASGDAKWLSRAERLMAQVMSEYRADGGGLLDTVRGRGGEGFLDHEIKPIQDSPTPSGNGVAGIVLSRLFEHTGRDEWREYRDELLEGLAGEALRLGIFAAALLRAADWAVMPAAHVVLVGEDDDGTRELRRTARNTYRPRKVLRWLQPGDPLEALPAAMRAMVDGTSPRAYVCVGMQCAAPVSSAAELAETLGTFAVTR